MSPSTGSAREGLRPRPSATQDLVTNVVFASLMGERYLISTMYLFHLVFISHEEGQTPLQMFKVGLCLVFLNFQILCTF